jgi:hypothetical protein
MFELDTRQVDYNIAFAQASIKEDVYVTMPRGFKPSDTKNDYVLKLNKSLYGLVQSPKAFYDHMRAGLKEMNFVTSENDPCLFIHKDMIVISWIDDLVFVSRDGSKIDEMVLSLKALGCDLDKEEGSGLSAFLDIQIDRTEGSIELSQPGLIDKVIRYTGMQDCNTGENTPASVTPLRTDSGGEPWVGAKENREYAAALGMLMYLVNHTCPDIAFAVNQCARFSFGPKLTHAKAIKRIVRYLQATRTRGMVFSPTGEIIVDTYADADFAGLWAVEHEQDPVCSKSRYLLELAGCPISWTSKLQTEIALPTMESEYIALSQAMRELIPLRRVVAEIASALGIEASSECRTHFKLFEDNNGALTMAQVPRITVRNRHFAVKYHFFRNHVSRGDIQVLKIDTTKQKADMLTKALVDELFVRLRLIIMGW